jgi:hypothetical protein
VTHFNLPKYRPGLIDRHARLKARFGDRWWQFGTRSCSRRLQEIGLAKWHVVQLGLNDGEAGPGRFFARIHSRREDDDQLVYTGAVLGPDGIPGLPVGSAISFGVEHILDVRKPIPGKKYRAPQTVHDYLDAVDRGIPAP